MQITISFEDMKDIQLKYSPLCKKHLSFCFNKAVQVDMINYFPLCNFRNQVQLIKAAIEKEEYKLKLDDTPND